MKKIILLVMALMLLAVAGAAIAQVDTQYIGRSPNILVSLSKQEPDPVEPGGQIELSFKLDNNGTAAENLMFEILPEYPFSLMPGESASKSIGVLGASQYGRQSFIIKYKLKVAPDAPDGSLQIKVRYKIDNYDAWTTIDNFRLRVQTHDAILSAEKILTMPPVTPPGEKTKLRIELRNYASSLLKDVKVSLDLSNAGTATIPFAPIGSTNEKVILYIEPLATVPLEFELLVDSDSASKAYRIPLILKYSDSLNKNYSRSNIITIVVGDKPNLDVALERTDVYTSGSTGGVVLRLVNRGNPDIKFLNVKVLPSSNATVVGADEVYIGKLDSDDFSTAEFKIYVTGKNSVKIPVQLEYKDTNNNNYKENAEVELKLYSSSEAKNFGVRQSNSLAWTIVLIVALGIGYYLYRRSKRNK